MGVATTPLAAEALHRLDRSVVPAERRRVEALARDLMTWQIGGPSILPRVLAELSDLMSLDGAAAHRLSPASDGWNVDFMHWHGPQDPKRAMRLWESGLAERKEQPTGFDPVRPERRQRNRALRTTPLYERDRLAVGVLLDGIGLADTDELRILLCDGPALLAWVGGWRQERFGRREAVILESLAPALCRRLALERDMGDARLHLPALKATLEVVCVPAFLARRSGTVVLMNQAAKSLADAGYAALCKTLAAAIEHPAPSAFRVIELGSAGVPDHFLLLRHLQRPEAATRAQELGTRWQLTPREIEVMALVVDGSANKTIATKLGIKLRTVELHVSRLLSKSGAARRAELAAMFWSTR